MNTLLVKIDDHTYSVSLKPSARGGEVYEATVDGETLSVTLPAP